MGKRYWQIKGKGESDYEKSNGCFNEHIPVIWPCRLRQHSG
jgi:hypothetical protein